MPLQAIPDAPSLNYVMDQIYDSLGGLCRTVEVKGMDLATIIARKVIPVYSKYFPLEETIVVKAEDQVPNREGFYYVKAANPIMSVNRAIGLMDTRSSISSTQGFSAGRSLHTIDTIQAVCSVTGSANLAFTLIDQFNLNNYSAAATLPITARFVPPNIVEFFPKQQYAGAGLVVYTMHPVTLETIGWNMIDEFIEYAKQEYFLSLKAIFKKYEKIQSIYGEINLDMEEFNNAASNKKEILEKWRKYSFFRSNAKRFYIA